MTVEHLVEEMLRDALMIMQNGLGGHSATALIEDALTILELSKT